MPYEQSPSPVAPMASSRLWTAGASGGVAILVLLALAVVHPELWGWLAIGAIAVGVATWMVNRAGPDEFGAGSSIEVVSVGEAPAPGALLASIFEAMEDPILIVSGGEADDVAGRRIALSNAAAREVLKSSPEGGRLVSVIRDPGVLEAVDEALFGGVASTVEYVGGGVQERRWRAVVRPLAGEAGEPLALLSLRDETDARRVEMMRVDFLANASHELRTPLASLTGFIETLKGHAREDPVARDRFLDIMAIQANRMSRLVADLLSLSRIELNEHIAPSGRVDIARAASDVIDAVSILARERNVDLRIERVGAEAAAASGDRDEIVQVIQNLVDNSIKYSPPGGFVEIEIRGDEAPEAILASRLPEATRLSLSTPDREAGARFVSISVRDRGPGMAREHLPRLTERFYRVEGQKSGERSGTGLGLAIVRHIIIRHRGGLSVESAPGQGAIFTAYFPVARARTETE